MTSFPSADLVDKAANSIMAGDSDEWKGDVPTSRDDGYEIA